MTLTIPMHLAGPSLNLKTDSRISPFSRVSTKSTVMPSISSNSHGRPHPFSCKPVSARLEISRHLVLSPFRSRFFRLRCLAGFACDHDQCWWASNTIFLLNNRMFARSGISNLEECPLNRNIPVFVLVGGSLALLKLLQVLWKQYNRHSGPSEEETADPQNGSV